MTFARRHFELSARQSDGATLRAHLQVAAKHGSVSARKMLSATGGPGPLGYLWGWFYEELHPRRGAGGMGPAPITWPDLDAWARRMERSVASWEFDLLLALDAAFFGSLKTDAAPASAASA